ncbi:hypothetical protein K492DRAFT_173530 [Lichtheimia hyalospora FSU 10163]|nr:hypothetical protein K492DRAFT_173530 [Lichtheimia hyalospora FSU 10163]
MSAALDRLGQVNTSTVLSMDTYWKNTMSVCEAAISMLAPFENQNHTLVDAATTSLRQLLTHGKEYSRFKQYSATTQRNTDKEYHPPFTHRPRKTIQDLGFNPRENWIMKDNKTVQVRLSNDTHVTCQAITTVNELDAILPVLRKANMIAIDCEFLGLKGFNPELKVLQLAVSSTLGYALAIDGIGLQAVRERLEPILSHPHQDHGASSAIAQQERLYLGWAFRGDAQAIEAAFPGIQLPYILDLQAKLRSVAVEQLSLLNAMKKYASKWSGLEEFRKAKQLGDTFGYSGYDCVWVQNPLPPECIVYAVFDVVSLIALHEAVNHHPTIPAHYWPETVISTLAPKALDRWLRTRAVAAASARTERSSNNNSLTLVETTVTTRKDKQPIRTESKAAASSSQAPPPGGFDDNDPQFKRDLEEALRRSRQEAEIQQGDTSGSSKHGSPADNENDDALLEEDFDGSEAHFATDVYDDTRNNRDGSNPIKLGTWDSVEETNYHELNQQDNSSSTMGDHEQQHPGYNYMHQISRAMNQHATGEFAFEPAPDQATWNNLAESSKNDWDRGVDVELNWSEVERRDAEQVKSTPAAETVKFHTSVHGHQIASWASQQKKTREDEWNTEDARPTMMQMRMNPLPKIKSKQKAKGPRVIIPGDDDDFSEDDDDDDDDDDDLSTGSSEATGDDINHVVQIEETYKDDIFLSEQGAIHVHLIRDVAQLTTLPPIDNQQSLTAAIGVQAHRVVTREGVPELHLKALQIYVSTGEAYTILTDHVHVLTGNNNREKIQSSTIGYILTSPNVRRIMWGFQFVADELQHRFGFEPSSMVDLAVCYNDTVGQDDKPISVWDAASEFANESLQQDLDMLHGYKNDMDALQHRKFSSSIWDKERVPEVALRYSAMQAWLLHHIYERTLERGHPPIKDYHVWHSKTKYSLEL